MPKQGKRRKLARLRNCLNDGKPWAIMPAAHGAMVEGIASGDLSELRAALATGEDIGSTTEIMSGVAVIPVTGVLRDEVDCLVRYGYATSYQLLEREYQKAIANSDIKAVAFWFDSPGGSAIGVKRAADAIYEGRGRKPVIGYVQGLCGSACYYLAAACDRIEATADSLVGSIGTIYPHLEASELYANEGIGVDVFTNSQSPKKSHGHPLLKMTPDSRATIQAFVNSYGSSFIEDVARYKGRTPADVAENFGQGDAMRADAAISRGMVDKIVSGLEECLEGLAGDQPPQTNPTPVVTGTTERTLGAEVMNKKIKAQLFARGLIAEMDASDEICTAALSAWFAASGESVPADDSDTLAALLAGPAKPPAAPQDPPPAPAARREDGIIDEQKEAKLADLRASAEIINRTAAADVVTPAMVMDSAEAGHSIATAVSNWNEEISKASPAVPARKGADSRDGAERFAADAIDAMLFRSVDQPDMQLSDNAIKLVHRPLWSIAVECLQIANGHDSVDAYGAREMIAESAMQMGNPTLRQTFYSTREDRRYLSAAGMPVSRPGDFPNILSGLANKYLDTVELDEDYSFPVVSAVLPGGLNDFKPAMMVNKGVVEELDELTDSESFKQVGLDEEVLSYLFLRRYGNKFGWTPVMIANDDLNAFAEGMLGLREAWMTTQNRGVVDRFTSTETLLDSSALFADRADTGTGNTPAANDNRRTGGAAPTDAEWGAMEAAYADIGGINTGKRVRGTINVCYCPTGAVSQEARRIFGTVGDTKVAATDANVGLYRGEVSVVPEPELRINSTTTYYGLRNPTRLNTATVVRGYFNGFGTAGRRERWYDPENKTTWVSLEGRIATAVKNWRYAIRNTV